MDTGFKHGATKYGWPEMVGQEWHKVRDVPDETHTQDASTNARIRLAARQWAERHGYVMEWRKERKGKVLFIRFHKEVS